MITLRAPFRLAALLALALLACGGDSAGPDDQQQEEEPPPSGPPDPGPGPHFSVVPVPIETLARVTPLGYTNKVMPISHTYWLTCDFDILLRSDRPCHREKQPLRAPRDGVVLDMLAAEDGYVVVEGPPGLIWHFGHVTPAPGLAPGDSFSAGQVIATMYYDHGFDFGMDNFGIENPFIRPERYPDGYLHGQHPIVQFPEPLRSQLTALVQTTNTAQPLGSLDWDVPGTAAGGWFLPDVPMVQSLDRQYEEGWMWLGHLPERPSTRLATVGYLKGNYLLVADPSAPDWEDITVGSGPVAIKIWYPAWATGEPNLEVPNGTLLVELQDSTHLRVEYFPTHDPVGGFTSNAKVFVR